MSGAGMGVVLAGPFKTVDRASVRDVEPGLFRGRSFTTGCTVDIQHTFESLHAHVALDGDIPLRPGDRVSVHGPVIHVPYGESVMLRRQATVYRAPFAVRVMVRLRSWFQLLELYEVSFSEEVRL